jgi:endonuclease G
VPGTVPESDGTPLATGIKRRPMVRERVGEDKPMQNQDTNDVRIAFPAALIEANGNININISNRGGMSAALPGPAKLQPSLNGGSEQDDLDEVKKLDIENSFDYSDCKGYDPNFLGVKIPLPKPKGKMLKFVAKLKSGNGSILDYYYFSTIHHSVRKMPMISGINVDGDPELRIDTFKRKDVWLRDNRLDYEMQLDDAFYKTSGFDKGHMSRREDADYGTSGELAKKFADLTCIYTNACPQVPELNRSNKKGLWGKLEEVVLEKGADLEKGQFAKISVFNGPIFDDDNDRFFRSVQIPMQFFKIIVWFNEAKKLQATAFKLSQENLVGGIDFEKLDFDTNAQFKEFQVSLSNLEKLTGLDLSDIKPFDTFKAADPDETLRIDSEEALRSLVDKAFVTTT